MGGMSPVRAIFYAKTGEYGIEGKLGIDTVGLSKLWAYRDSGYDFDINCGKRNLISGKQFAEIKICVVGVQSLQV